jgi:restriction system protein
LGQVKCYKPENPVGFEPIAIIHSQMIKQKALGGFVVTTSYFTPNAIKYSEELNINLIDGQRLIDMWTQGVENTINQTNKYLNNNNSIDNRGN